MFKINTHIGNVCNGHIHAETIKQKNIGLCTPEWLDIQVEWMFNSDGLRGHKVNRNMLREYLVSYILREFDVIAFGVDNGIN